MSIAKPPLHALAALLIVCGGAVAASADGVWPSQSVKFLSVSGGGMLPLAGSSWRDTVDASPTFVLRGGDGVSGSRAALLVEGSLEISPLSADDNAGAPAADLFRVRALAGARFESPANSFVIKVVRAGLGVDLLLSDGDTDTGFALELGAGVWRPFGPVLLGLEAALPMSIHGGSNDSSSGSVDFSLLAGVTFRATTGEDD